MKKARKVFALLISAIFALSLVPNGAWAATSDVNVTVTYNSNGGSGANMANDTVTVPANSDYTLFELDANQYVAPNGKVFLGWGETNNATQTVDRIVVKDTDTTKNVYAIWGDNRASSGNNQELNGTGSITINNSVEGETYTAYQLFQLFSWTDDDTAADQHASEAYTYYIDTTHPLYSFLQNYKYDGTNSAFTFDTDHNNATIVTGKTLTPVKATDGFLGLTGTPENFNDENTEAEYQAPTGAKFQDFARAVMDQIKGLQADDLAKISKQSTTASGETTTISNLPLGYYVVDSTLGSLCALDTTNANVTIVDKNEVTIVAKQVKEDGGSEQSGYYGDKNDADLGQVVEYKTTVTIPLRQSNVIFHDTMSAGLTLVPGSIMVNGTDVSGHFTIYDSLTSDNTNHNLPNNDKYTGDTFAVMFDNAWTESLTASVDVTITYNAILNENAIVGDQNGLAMGAGNDNQCDVTFGDAQSTESDWTRTYTWDFDLFKFTGDAQSPTALAGAKFTVAKSSDASTNLEFVLIAEGTATEAAVYRLAVTEDTGKVTELETPASGKINIQGLDADTYTLTETVAPTGYNKLSGTISYTIDSNTDSAQGNDNTKQTDGTVTYSHTFDGKTDTAKQVDVLNQSGTELPSTGGIGTTIFYVIGGILVAGSIVLLITKRRMAAEA